MYIATYADSDALSHQAAQLIVRLAAESVVTHGRFTIALSGGSTPRKSYNLLAGEPYRSQIDWALVEVFLGDERCVPADDTESNFRMAQETLLSKVPIAEKQIHRMPADQPDRHAAARDYVIEMQRVFGTTGIPSFDLIQLGMGPEGHTASLFPHSAALHEQEHLVVPVRTPKPPPDRLTFTPPLLNAARHVLFLVTGSDKADAVHEVIEGEYNPDEYPAQIVRPSHGEVTWMLDTTAASKLSR